nr:ATP-binding protein [uncultured Olsenella sp.]
MATSTPLSDALVRADIPLDGSSAIAPVEETEEYRLAVAQARSCSLRKAGLVGAYATADCEAGREAYRMAVAGRGSYLWGLPGRGKTYAAACCVRLALAEGRHARLVTASKLLDGAKAAYDGGDRHALERASSVWLLALDDLGAERPTEWAMETLTGLVDARTASGLPTVVTSNYSLGQLRDRWGGMPGARVASRLAGACHRVEFGGPDRRCR